MRRCRLVGKMAYDSLNRLTAADYRSTTLTAGSTGEHYEYAYDAVGNRTAMTETTALAETTVTTYTYDAANRLTRIQQPASSLVSTLGMREATSSSDGTFTYAYNALQANGARGERHRHVGLHLQRRRPARGTSR